LRRKSKPILIKEIYMNNIADGSVNIQPCIGYLAHPFEKEPPWVCIILRFLMAGGYSTIDRRRKLFSYTRENTDVWAADQLERRTEALEEVS
jgi:hypothetical protein